MVGDLRDVGQVQAVRPGAAAQDLGGRGDHGVEAEERIGRLELVRQVAGPDLVRDLLVTLVRVGPAQPDRGDATLLADVLVQRDRVQCRHAVTGADRPGVDAFVREVAVIDGPVLVADEPVGADGLGVEIDLRAGIERDRLGVPVRSSVNSRSASSGVLTYA